MAPRTLRTSALFATAAVAVAVAVSVSSVHARGELDPRAQSAADLADARTAAIDAAERYADALSEQARRGLFDTWDRQNVLVSQIAGEKAVLELALVAADAALHNMDAVAQSQSEFAAQRGAAAGQVATGAATCPVAGSVAFVNDWGAPRSGGRTHEGNDLFAAAGTPVVAVVAGTIHQSVDDLGGFGVDLRGEDGNRYYHAHLSAWEGTDRVVRRGEVIGYVGATGNAAGGPPHLHFQIHPGGGAPVNPYPTVEALCP